MAMVDVARDIRSDMAGEPVDVAGDGSSGDPGRPPGTLSYAEAAEATGLSRRHLRRLVAAGTLEAVDMGGRRWVATASLLAAGHQLRGPSGWKTGEDSPEAAVGGHGRRWPPDSPGQSEELVVLRYQVKVAETLAEERSREIARLVTENERLYNLATRAMAMLSSGEGTSPPAVAEDGPRPRPRRWFRRRG